MTIRYDCAECGASLNIKDELAGTKGRCPKCKTEFTVPALQAAADSGATGQREPAAAKSSGAGFDDDDITAILSADESSPATAVSARGKEDSSGDDDNDGGYAVGDAASRGGDGPGDDGLDPLDDKKKQSAKKKARNREEEQRLADAASVARTLMGRSGKSDGDGAGETPKKRFGKIFGAGPDRTDDDEAFSAGEVAKFFTVQYGAPIVGVAVACFLLYWLGTSMIGGSNTPPLGRVTGMVTLDGKPLPNAVITFIPMSEEANKEVKGSGSSAYTDASGKYDLQYSPEEFGALIGKHLITVTALDPATGMELLPPAYNTMSTLNDVVKPGSNTIDLPLQSQPGAK